MNKTIEKIINNVDRVIKGKTDVIKLALVPLISEGHIILQDVPGVGKSTLAEAIAYSIGGSFKRIQFTSDLLPSDIIGVNIFNRAKNSFEFKKGPIFANVVLADEINRTSPKTQSALLEAMNERKVTVDGTSYQLPEPFFVIATENPIEFAGTYPLPESELDRFMLSLDIGYPDESVEKEIILKGKINPQKALTAITSGEEIKKLIQASQNVFVEESILNYTMEIVKATRKNKFIKVGISIRGSIDFMRAIKSYAFIQGRNFVIPDDVKFIAPYALSHRLILREGERKFAKEIIYQIIEEINVPL